MLAFIADGAWPGNLGGTSPTPGSGSRVSDLPRSGGVCSGAGVQAAAFGPLGVAEFARLGGAALRQGPRIPGMSSPRKRAFLQLIGRPLEIGGRDWSRTCT